jgi:hypothetical protein
VKWSKGFRFFFPATLIVWTALLVIPACTGGFPGIGPGSDTDIAAVLSLNTSTCEFGVVASEAASASLPIEVTNDGAAQVTLTAVQLSDTVNFSSDDSLLPLTLAPGESVSIECTFHPMESGSLQATLEITADGFDNALDTALSGEGNYPPAVAPGMMVYDTNPVLAGFYCPDGEFNEKTLYRSIDNPQYMLFFHVPSNKWVLNDDLLITYFESADRYQSPTPKVTYDSPAEVENWNQDSTDVWDDVSGPIVSGADLSDVTFNATTAHVYYYYCDAENDAEDSSVFTWYRCSSESDPGTPIPGVVGSEYTIQSADLDCYLRVEMIPCAGTGIPEGTPISGPVSGPIHPHGLGG